MPVLGITGGVACGKSTVAARLAHQLNAPVISTDDIARRLLDNDPQVRSLLVEAFGADLLHDDGSVDRQRLRKAVFEDKSLRNKLEGILHPLIRKEWVCASAPARGAASPFCVVEIPLLFETGAEVHCDATIAVACDRQTQMARIMTSRGLDANLAASMIAAQMPLSEKLTRADHVLWNDGSLDALLAQTDRLASNLRRARKTASSQSEAVKD